MLCTRVTMDGHASCAALAAPARVLREELAKLDETGRLHVADGADFSPENVERARRLHDLVRSGLDREEVRKAAQEIHDLARRCTHSFLRR